MQQALNILLILFMSALLSAVQASIAANTWVVTGASQTKSKSSVKFFWKKMCFFVVQAWYGVCILSILLGVVFVRSFVTQSLGN